MNDLPGWFGSNTSDRTMIYLKEEDRNDDYSIDYLQEVQKVANIHNIKIPNKYVQYIREIIPHANSGVLYPHTVYAAYYLFYKYNGILIFNESIIDDLLLKWCKKIPEFNEMFKKSIDRSTITITCLRVMLAIHSSTMGALWENVNPNANARALRIVESVVGKLSIEKVGEYLDNLNKSVSVNDVIIGRIGFFAFKEWFYSQEPFLHIEEVFEPNIAIRLGK